ncbi:hypothetical protein E2P81_ATG10100 [Venturia nashicola]|uniref:Uncharacterized protein n=1 Tax=Venturia nashicola TaxID=86259 RepID=A0A4Z1NHN4_9PEZI|nr:hypothetical protein E6O75_ATG10321 [Venturia nashicola]TLD18278.1 hypothetical protein E2P81_ATG10100 [Venturia nashicola]
MLFQVQNTLLLFLVTILANALPLIDEHGVPFNLMTDPAAVKLDICSSKMYVDCHINLHPEANKCYTTYSYLKEENGYKVASIALGEGTRCTLYGSVACETFSKADGYTFEIRKSMGDLVQDPKRKWPFSGPYRSIGVLSFKCWCD